MIERMNTAQTHTELDAIVTDYLTSIGEADNARGETYEATAERLNDPIMQAAASRWHELS